MDLCQLKRVPTCLGVKDLYLRLSPGVFTDTARLNTCLPCAVDLLGRLEQLDRPFRSRVGATLPGRRPCDARIDDGLCSSRVEVYIKFAPPIGEGRPLNFCLAHGAERLAWLLKYRSYAADCELRSLTMWS